ncbi:MAG: phospholipid carrier-dependent glycosyltransferase [Deltaproteobacteria bacterium]
MTTNNVRISNKLFAALLCLIILMLLIIEIILNLTPPISRDALIHHLAIPKLWQENGGFYEIKWADFSYYPMNIDLLYTIPLYLNKDFIAKFIHMSFGIGTALLIYLYLNRKISRIAGLLGILVFLSTPMVIRLSTVAYVDLGLTFFTTAAIFSFIRYRDGKFKEIKWLLLSSVAMGLALGTKYNALIAWFFLSTAIIFIYSRDTGEQWKAVQCGLIFFLVSLVVFSPWLIKNILLTGNPLYPLLQGIFNMADQNPNVAHSISGGTYSGIFQMREAMFGESFWETLLIPIRYFFQGQDDNFRYFDGVLNPVLIILSPFAFINRSFYRDKLFFTGFAVFFILTATYLDQTRIRYILPTIPVLSVLAVMGFMNILEWTMNRSSQSRQILAVIFIFIFIVIMGQNIFYIKNYYQKISPMNYVLGKESRDEFISRHIGSYAAIQYINQHTPENAKIRLVLLAGRGYYLNRAYEDDSSMGMSYLSGLVKASETDQSFQNRIHSPGHTHLLLRTALFHKYLQDNYPPETVNRFLQQMNRSTEMIYNENGYAIYRIISAN